VSNGCKNILIVKLV